MGFFSWHAQDTGRSIANVYQEVEPTFPVMMTDNKGNRWIEDKYDGYGEFGGKDFYELLAEMNGLTTREQGIDLAFNEEGKKFLSPNLSEDMQWTWRDEAPESCSDQGYFYSSDEDDYDEEYDDDDEYDEEE